MRRNTESVDRLRYICVLFLDETIEDNYSIDVSNGLLIAVELQRNDDQVQTVAHVHQECGNKKSLGKIHQLDLRLHQYIEKC